MMKATLFAAATALLSLPALAAPILTGAGNETCNGGACYVQNVNQAWQAPANGAVWLAPKPAGTYLPIGTNWTYEQTIEGAFDFALTVLCDDFCRTVTVNGSPITLSRQASFDAARAATVSFTTGAGMNTISFDVSQRGSQRNDRRNSAGIMVYGTATPVEASPVPVPAALPLMAAGVALLAYKGRRKA